MWERQRKQEMTKRVRHQGTNLFGVDGKSGKNTGDDVNRETDSLDGVEQTFLVLLLVWDRGRER